MATRWEILFLGCSAGPEPFRESPALRAFFLGVSPGLWQMVPARFRGMVLIIPGAPPGILKILPGYHSL